MGDPGTDQVIIKFRGENLDPSQKDFVEELSRTAHAKVIYVRPMSGGAYVFRVPCTAGGVPLTEIIRRLSERPDIRHIEADTMMRHQMEP